MTGFKENKWVCLNALEGLWSDFLLAWKSTGFWQVPSNPAAYKSATLSQSQSPLGSSLSCQGDQVQSKKH